MYFLDMIECNDQHVDLLISGEGLSKAMKCSAFAVGDENSLQMYIVWVKGDSYQDNSYSFIAIPKRLLL